MSTSTAPVIAGGSPAPTATLLPDPEPRPIRMPIISVDDHLCEPRDVFEGRMPAHLADRAPRIVEIEGREVWMYEDKIYPNIGFNAIVGRPREEWGFTPARYDEIRPGCFDIDARIKDMDVAGIWASLSFPSLVAGFCGAVFMRSKDQELGLACVRAWNQWHHEVWAAPYPDRVIPLQLPWLNDPTLAAEEIRKNAARGFKAVSFPEFPFNLGLPSIFTDAWDPFLAACEETETVLCLHIGASAWEPPTSPDSPFVMRATMFPVSAQVAIAEWLWSNIPLRFPRLKIAMSEGGMGWVPMIMDRVDFVMTHSASGGTDGVDWPSSDLPSEILRRSFWYCSIDDPSIVPVRHTIGIDHIMVESDYPHPDTTWPDTQAVVEDAFRGVPDDELRMMTSENAARLFHHPLPPKDDWRTT